MKEGDPGGEGVLRAESSSATWEGERVSEGGCTRIIGGHLG